jgi:putative aldouronate transport system substrate-binding protein
MKTKVMLIVGILMVITTITIHAGGQKEKVEPTGIVVNKTGFPIVEEKITLKGFALLGSANGPYEEMRLFRDYEKMTNIHIEWDTPGAGNVNERKNLILASGDLPDFFIRDVLDDSDIVRYGDDGTLIPLKDYFEQYGTNISQVLKKYPEIEKSITAPDGHIYGLPYTSIHLPTLVWRYPLVNMTWIERLGLNCPTNHQELIDMLRVFRDKDANGNGDPTDEIPYSGHNNKFLFFGIAGMFGIKQDVEYDFLYPIKVENRKVKIQVTDDNYKEALQYFAVLFQEGLMDQEIFIHSSKDYFAKLADGRIGYTVLWQPQNAGKYATEYDAIVPLKGPRGDQYWNFKRPVVYGRNCFSITSANKYPEATVRWVDYFYSDEGATKLYLVDEEFYTVTSDGKFKFKKEILEAPEGFTRFMGKQSMNVGAFVPAFTTAKHQEPRMAGTPMLSYIEKVKPYLNNNVVQIPLFEPEDQKRINQIRSDLDVYLQEMQANFTTGKASFDKWNEYVATVKRMGLEEMELIIQKALFR